MLANRQTYDFDRDMSDAGQRSGIFDGTDERLAMGFAFLEFPAGFELPFSEGAEVKAACKTSSSNQGARRIRDAFDDLRRVYPTTEARA